ncbi:Methanogenic corrinoid protein MtbC1 [Pelagirhabdus alkalitolerans]|uniref:Methanogenic corrinoid protein MtbC1 n=1 Tax=Pelagirhabdus alkalitolerans TaxID=1612202 RepID=A0A1G6H993_9BACI|nr:cobalamin-dependent protein [Pelagirhabdus alkalitolerans]SDB90668.1 Methanogenic corrinoid protein MtbC1 [Pelagirhabdus alkalitolerans]
MSLLTNYTDPSFIKIAQYVFKEQFKMDPQLYEEMNERRQKAMYDDVVYNISFLMTAIQFEDKDIFEHYAVWLYELLTHLMPDLDRDRIMQQMIDHYMILSKTLMMTDLLTDSEKELAQAYLKAASEVTRAAVTNVAVSTSFEEGPFYEYRRDYLDALLCSDIERAHELIQNAYHDGISIPIIYESILKKTMHEIGVLWHQNDITVDREHFATSVTQNVMAKFYDDIFQMPRKNHTLVSCTIGDELHELGIRMLSDLFEYDGWDTFYLGSSLSQDSILSAIDTHKPDVLALSVTMPPYLGICEAVINQVRTKYPTLNIAVGGQAFSYTDRLWERWPVDFYSTDARTTIAWANDSVDDVGGGASE